MTETVRDFLDPADFHNLLKKKNMDFYAGVPDSLLKDLCAYVTDVSSPAQHVITANEGSAVSLATGYHLATKKFPIVYMQNSGFGNTVNPLLSLTDPKVYAIPMLMLIGWRGEPGKKDEPQHIVQGKVMTSLLTDLGIQYEVLPDYLEGAEIAVDAAITHMQTRKAPYAFLIKKQTFLKYKLQNVEPNEQDVSREEAISMVLDECGEWDVFVGTTGFTSRELYEIRDARGEEHNKDFLTVGSMGHASAIGLGVAVAKPSRTVVTLDGDGAALMHLGNMATAGIMGLKNFKHVLINNGAHDSVGGQPTQALNFQFVDVAKATGYKWAKSVTKKEDIILGVKELLEAEGPALLEIRTNKGARANLGRPKSSPIQNKEDFMAFLEG
jgi:phosphonopyruvate decarboxylase